MYEKRSEHSAYVEVAVFEGGILCASHRLLEENGTTMTVVVKVFDVVVFLV